MEFGGKKAPKTQQKWGFFSRKSYRTAVEMRETETSKGFDRDTEPEDL